MSTLRIIYALARRQDDPAAGDIAVPTIPVLTNDPAPTVVASIWVMMAFATIFLLLRIYCKAVRTRGMWWDDYIMLFAWFFLMAATAVLTELMRMGFGLTLGFVPRMHTLSTTADVLNKVALGLSKTSFALTLLRVAQGWQKWFIWFMVVTMNGVLATNAVTTWRAACDREGQDKYEAVLPGSCWSVVDAVIIAMVANSYSALVDFALALLPWKIVWKLQMKKYEKIGVAIAMSLGLVAGIVGVIKVVSAMSITAGPDIPYRLSMLFIWGQAEPNVTIVATTIPVLRVLFRDIHRSKYPAAAGVSGQGGGGSGGGYLRSNGASRFPASALRGATLVGEGSKGREDDEDSEGSILRSKGGIVRTAEVTVDSSSRAREQRWDVEEVFEMVGPSAGRGQCWR
ncbi:conserved hypothetical protein [Verticillium alfalfae VaMs.102]|uniref:Rhodopsin domain-containing protein n=1 Tax=Verticillium alfalfae (strain VaMs.102 / ATCC MYA-4576 / FGSC 10136) TaxID=526221 RepID=C9SDH4_VERA1|nr:conserved hypothetical protein [Verticillium alfalfae VaMs.102]EEY17126.1 conserved hypothetical protein [Verticillium alfalfae VaMs.102]